MDKPTPEFIANPLRSEVAESGGTGIYVRAKRGEAWASVDILELTRDSLLDWLRSRDEREPDVGAHWRESVILICFGYEPHGAPADKGESDA